MMKYIGRAIATCASALVCGFGMYVSEGETGLGWFAFSLLIIWATATEK